jgi:HD-GYP domain-containing protein (c-di-GMP phosphodiesterase class II)
MDSSTFELLKNPDPEALQDFIDALSDHVPDIERTIAQLEQRPGDKQLIDNLFRGLHTVKGDAALCKIDIGVAIAHPVESMMSRVRNGEIPFSDIVVESILLALDRLELAMNELAAKRSLGQMKLAELISGLHRIADAPANRIDAEAEQLIRTVTGFSPSSLAQREELLPGPAFQTESASGDLHFFRILALQYELHSPLFAGRSERQRHLALETNRVAGTPVNPLQLEAAIYLHDVGMMFIPDAIWVNPSRLTDDDRLQLQRHPEYAAGLLQRMPGWDEAAQMILQHHERQDGSGYPKGLQNRAIVPGAKLLAILDTFESVTLKHSSRGHGRSMVRAMAEINACDTLFDPTWIAHFNSVIRRMVEA